MTGNYKALIEKIDKCLNFKVIRLRFELKTHSLEGCCSIQLSYRTILYSDIRTKRKDKRYFNHPFAKRPYVISGCKNNAILTIKKIYDSLIYLSLWYWAAWVYCWDRILAYGVGQWLNMLPEYMSIKVSDYNNTTIHHSVYYIP